MKDDKVYYTLEEVRNLIFSQKISKSTIRKLAITGQIPTVRIFSKRLVPVWWVTEALANATNAPSNRKEATR